MIRYFENDSPVHVIKRDLKADFLGTVFFLLRYASIFCRQIVTTQINKTNLKIINVEYGKKIKFIGWGYISRYPQSVITIGQNCTFNSASTVNLIGVNHRCLISTQKRGAILKIGNNCGFSGTTISAFKKIIIGDNVKAGANVLITDSDWHPEDRRAGENKPVIIEDNVWIGVNSVVLKGVIIGENSLIGANSVVTKNIPPNSVAVGNPCRVVKTMIIE